MRKGILEMVILSIISEKEAYPSDIIRELKKSELIVVEGTLYPLLSRLRKSELLDYTWRESTSGPPRKYYYLTEEGLLFLSKLIKAWRTMVSSVDKILDNLERQKE